MIFTVLLICEIVLAAAILIPIYFLSVPFGIALSILLIGAIVFFTPALRVSRRYADRHRAVRHNAVTPTPGVVIGVRPSGLSPAEVGRLLEAAGMLSPLYARTGALCATFLDLNCRGLIGWEAAENGEDTSLLFYDNDGKSIKPHEAELLHALQLAAHGKDRVRLSALAEYAAAHTRRLQYRIDRFDRMATHALLSKKCLYRGRSGKRRVLCLSKRGVEEASLWREYFRFLRDGHPDFWSYPDDMKTFRREVEECLCFGEAAGLFSMVQNKMLSDYVFEPTAIWAKDQLFSRLANANDETRAYLRRVLETVVGYGSVYYHRDGFDDILKDRESI